MISYTDRGTTGRREIWAKIWVPLLLVSSTIALGLPGFYRYYQNLGQPISYWDAFLYAAGLPIQQTTVLVGTGAEVPLALQAARVLGLFVVPYAFVLAFVILFGDLIRPVRIRSWSWRLRPGRRRHAVVCGLGEKGFELAGDLLERGERVAVVESDGTNGLVSAARERGAVVILGDARQPGALRNAHLAAASRVFITCGRDEDNVRVLKQVIAVMQTRNSTHAPAVCNVEIRDPRTRELVHRTLTRRAGLEVNSFNTFEATARQLLQQWPADRFALGAHGQEARVVVLGYTPMARAILLQVMLQGHFAPPQRLHLTVLTEAPERDERSFMTEYPCFRAAAFTDHPSAERLRQRVLPTVQFARLPESDTELLDEENLLLRAVSPATTTSIFVCLDGGLRSAAYVAAVAPSLAAAAADRPGDVQLCYYYEYPEDDHRVQVEEALRRLAPGLELCAFDNFLDGCSADRVEARPLDDMARELAQVYREAYGGPDWLGLDEADRMANRRAADHIAVKLRMVGASLVPLDQGDRGFQLTPDEVEVLSDAEHRRWSAEKLLTGWRPLPRTPQNLERWRADKEWFKAQKLHPDLVPYDEVMTQAKDRLQVLAIPRIAEAAGKGVRRFAEPPTEVSVPA